MRSTDHLAGRNRTTRARGVVLHDWIDATAAEQRTAVVRALAKKYKVKYEVPTRDGGE
jgi:hypothetical protein